jgi:hypothetical protein
VLKAESLLESFPASAGVAEESESLEDERERAKRVES